MKNVGRVIMILGVAIAFVNYISYIGRTETIMQQLFQVAETMMIMTGFYIFGKGISFSFNRSDNTTQRKSMVKKYNPLRGNAINEITIYWTCPHCNNENTRNKTICEKCNIIK